MIEVADFTADGWHPAESAAARARACCAALERGEILLLRDLSLLLEAADREILTRLPPRALAEKNVALDPGSGRLRGLRRGIDGRAIGDAMARYRERVVRLCGALLAPYAGAWKIELSSFRPLEERGRRLRRRQRNDLLHIDSFPSRPTNGARILRCFTNIHPSRPRVWTTAPPFATLSRELLSGAQLERIAAHTESPWRRLRQRFLRARRTLGVASPAASAYDKFMLSLHDRMKTDASYQNAMPAIRHEFPPGATWLVFTDAVPHAVVEGQFALEQTFFIPREALILPAEAPVAIVERLTGRRMTV